MGLRGRWGVGGQLTGREVEAADAAVGYFQLAVDAAKVR
jgi:hypothetical protein